MLRLALALVFIFAVKKPSFATASSCCYSFHGEVSVDEVNGFICESVYVYQRNHVVKFRPKLAIQILLLLCGDIELCPGPERSIPELDRLLKQRGMHLFHQNVRGLLRNKDYVLDLLENFKTLHFLALTETHINKDVDYGNIFEIPGYDFVSRPRQNGSGGGVGLYIHSQVNWKRRLDLESAEIEGIIIEVMPHNANSFFVFAMYRPPDSSKYLHKHFNKIFNAMLSQLSPKECILMGYCNVDFSKRTDNDIAILKQLYNYLVLNK